MWFSTGPSRGPGGPGPTRGPQRGPQAGPSRGPAGPGPSRGPPGAGPTRGPTRGPSGADLPEALQEVLLEVRAQALPVVLTQGVRQEEVLLHAALHKERRS